MAEVKIRDNYTKWIEARMEEWDACIYEIEDRCADLQDNVDALVDYLKSIPDTMSLGLALRRYLCAACGERTETGWRLRLTDGTHREVCDYMAPGYDIAKDDVSVYTEVMLDLNGHWNRDGSGEVLLPLTRAEARRMLRLPGACTRKKMFELSFALHMDYPSVDKFLKDVLGEATYNLRDPKEVIAFFCQAHAEYNSYPAFLRFEAAYRQLPAADAPPTENYTRFAGLQLRFRVRTPEELMDFLQQNAVNFHGFSQTAKAEFLALYHAAMEVAVFNTENGPRRVENNEQLAKALLEFIPRFSRRRGDAVSTEFLHITNADGRGRTTDLPKSVTVNLPMRDRLDDLLADRKPVERKDLVYLKFFVFYMRLFVEGDGNTGRTYLTFLEETNAMLERCRMSRLYPGNPFERLILLSLLSETPFDTFSDIMSCCFFNEPATENN